ncbi:MAG TPA: rhodanese-like domain-containing protein [Anaerolineae bacterium]|nr:rhodanese-like domain-containing protein [Anaerolineae bacterium]
MNPYGVPEIDVMRVAEMKDAGEPFILLDVREPMELQRANLGDTVLLAPLSRLAREQEAALPSELNENKEQKIVVFCHHGMRSAQVTAWLQQNGWTNVFNMSGGIDAYARQVDISIGVY